jgi:hypothetical protein
VYGISSTVFQSPANLRNTWAAEFTASGSTTAGKLKGGYLDEDVAATGTVLSSSFTGNYSVDSTGTGRVTATTTLAGGRAGPTLVFYLTGPNSQALVLDTDKSAVGAGIVYPQTAGATFNGTYGAYFAVNDETINGTGADSGGVAQFTANQAAGTLSGNAYAGYYSGGNTGLGVFGATLPLSGSNFAPGAKPGRLTGVLYGLSTDTPSNNFAFYLIDSSHGFFIENDGVQAALGYFAAQTPVTQLAHSAIQEHSRRYRRRQN